MELPEPGGRVSGLIEVWAGDVMGERSPGGAN